MHPIEIRPALVVILLQVVDEVRQLRLPGMRGGIREQALRLAVGVAVQLGEVVGEVVVRVMDDGQLGIIGPVAVEGYARMTPYPIRIGDGYAGLGLHVRTFGVSLGWRWLEIVGDDEHAPKASFNGFQGGLVVAF